MYLACWTLSFSMISPKYCSLLTGVMFATPNHVQYFFLFYVKKKKQKSCDALTRVGSFVESITCCLSPFLYLRSFVFWSTAVLSFCVFYFCRPVSWKKIVVINVLTLFLWYLPQWSKFSVFSSVPHVDRNLLVLMEGSNVFLKGTFSENSMILRLNQAKWLICWTLWSC